MILANDFSSGLIRFQKLLAQMANRVLLDLARAGGERERKTERERGGGLGGGGGGKEISYFCF